MTRDQSPAAHRAAGDATAWRSSSPPCTRKRAALHPEREWNRHEPLLGVHLRSLRDGWPSRPAPALWTGGKVQAISETTAGGQAHAHFLFGGTVELLGEHGCVRVRKVGKHAWIVGRPVAGA
jgi:hypothetical protein